jgi:hypothetical protein
MFAFLVMIGLGTDIAAVLLFATHIYLIYHSKYFSVEDITIQYLLLHLPFLRTGAVFSVDAVVGVSSQLGSAAFFNSLFVINALIMLSAGYEKMKSEPWRDGVAVQYFLQSPHITRSLVRQYLPPRWLLRLAGFIVLIAEFSLLFSVLNRYAFVAVSIILLGFAVSLYTLVDLSYIGQLWTIALGLFVGTVVQNVGTYPTTSRLFAPSIELGTVVSFLLASTALIVVFYPAAAANWKLTDLQQYTTGITTPIAVFNERHLYGLFTYRLDYVTDDSTESTEQVLPAFAPDGTLGPLQQFRPRYFQGAMYPVTDYCLTKAKNGDPQTPPDRLIDLCYAGLRDAGVSTGTVILSVKPFNADTPEEYLSNDWYAIGSCTFSEDEFEWEPLEAPPTPERITR